MNKLKCCNWICGAELAVSFPVSLGSVKCPNCGGEMRFESEA